MISHRPTRTITDKDNHLGELINFNEPLLKDGITRIINNSDYAQH